MIAETNTRQGRHYLARTSISLLKRTALRLVVSLMLVTMVSLLGLDGSGSNFNPPVSAAPLSQAGCKTFSETANGYVVCGRFLQYWQVNGGLAQQGLPISTVFEEKNAPPPAGDGKVHKVQYFERARFEEHLENAVPYDVLLGLLGTEQFKAKYPEGKADEINHSSPCQKFAQTGYTVCNNFLNYWHTHGGLAQQGLPISGVFFETNAPPPAGDGKLHMVQYFERARFEEHVENSGTPYEVLLGLLGTEQFRARYPQGEKPFSNIQFLKVHGGKAGSQAEVMIQTAPNVICAITYVSTTGLVTLAPGLFDQISDNSGIVDWQWTIVPRTPPGTARATVNCVNQGGSATTNIIIT